MALMISVSGVRGLVGQTLSPALVMEFAQAYGTLLDGGRVVLARDTRPSGELYACAAAAGLLAAGCPVTRLGVAMTPTVGFAIRRGGFRGGVSITASHNPSEWNGVKFLDELGVAPDPLLARRIVELRDSRRFRSATGGFVPMTEDGDVGRRHVAAVLDAVETDAARLRGMRVVLDSVNGAGCRDTPELLRALGCELVHLNNAPTGEFAHRPEPLRENLTQLAEAVRVHGAAIGLAQDPDADRLALVDERGEYIGEEYTLALAAWAVLSRRPGPVAANLSTSRMVDDVARKYGVTVHRTPVGEAHVARTMLARQCVIGGEGNGGVIDPRICMVRDSLSAASLVLQLMAQTGKPLSALVAELPRYATIKEKYELPRDRIDAAVAAVQSGFASRQPNTADGVRIDFPDGWVHIRASNTEPIMRIIGEATDEASARTLVADVRRVAGI